jgi:hypothetical protein
MLCTDIRGIIAEEEEVQRHKDALETLLSVRYKLMRESLEERIRRAQDKGEWIQLSQEERAALHEREKLHVKSQIDRLRHEQDRTRGKLAVLRRTKERAKSIRAAEVASQRHRH